VARPHQFALQFGHARAVQRQAFLYFRRQGPRLDGLLAQGQRRRVKADDRVGALARHEQTDNRARTSASGNSIRPNAHHGAKS